MVEQLADAVVARSEIRWLDFDHCDEHEVSMRSTFVRRAATITAVLAATTILDGGASADVATEDPAISVTQNPVGIASFAERFTAGPDGALWFTLPPADVARLDTTALRLERIPAGGLLPGTTGITTGPDGAIWFGTLLGGYLGRIDPATRYPICSRAGTNS
ncbi:hypothetical protein [Nocardia nepalensis]|uniref:hypothetical protein n=1 Tax=Nocardia nepalensis TaxID=3375448 RepID=UPI003B674F3B